MSESEPQHRDHVHALFIKNSPRIRGFVLSILPNMSRADDVLQETFLTVTAKADDFSPGTSFISWACRIAQYKVLEECKRNRKSGSCLSPEVIEAVCAVYSPTDNGFKEDQLLALNECLKSLAPHTQRAIELRYGRAHKAPEIANLLGWTTDSVYVVLSRARDALQKCVQSRLGVDVNGS